MRAAPLCSSVRRAVQSPLFPVMSTTPDLSTSEHLGPSQQQVERWLASITAANNSEEAVLLKLDVLAGVRGHLEERGLVPEWVSGMESRVLRGEL